MTQNRNILITGANGLLGRRVCMELSGDGCNVHALVHAPPKNPLPNVKYQEIDFSANWKDEDLPGDIDTIIHLAQSSKFRDFPNGAMDILKVNIDSTAQLLDYARKTEVKQFMHASSGGVYGTGEKAFDENSPINSSGELGYYLGSKLCGEILVQNYASIMNVIVLRFFFMYGPEQNKSMLIPRLVESVRNGTAITLQGHDGIQLNPIHAADAANALVKLVGMEESCALNIAGPDILTLRQIAETIGETLGKTPIFEVQDTAPKHLVANIDGMKKNSAAPTISFKNGVQDFV